jgi:hypothetical protein
MFDHKSKQLEYVLGWNSQYLQLFVKIPTGVPLSFISYNSDNSLLYFKNVVAEV